MSNEQDQPSPTLRPLLLLGLVLLPTASLRLRPVLVENPNCSALPLNYITLRHTLALYHQGFPHLGEIHPIFGIVTITHPSRRIFFLGPRPAPRRVEFGPRYPSAMMHEHNSSLQLLQYLVFQWSSSPLCAHTDAHRMIPFSWHMFCNVLCILMNAGHLSAKRHTPRLVFPRRP